MQTMYTRALGAVIAAVLAMPGAVAEANGTGFRVAFAEVPGIGAIEAGDIDAAIAILEERRDNGAPPLPDELSTLCAAYVMLARYATARASCDAAVATDGSEAAYNNRGVLRAYLGDIEGAMRDFERVRVPPPQVDAFVAGLREGNPRLMATNNFDVVRKARAARREQSDAAAFTAPAAEVEDLQR